MSEVTFFIKTLRLPKKSNTHMSVISPSNLRPPPVKKFFLEKLQRASTLSHGIAAGKPGIACNPRASVCVCVLPYRHYAVGTPGTPGIVSRIASCHANHAMQTGPPKQCDLVGFIAT
jgi:hypothetical protein